MMAAKMQWLLAAGACAAAAVCVVAYGPDDADESATRVGAAAQGAAPTAAARGLPESHPLVPMKADDTGALLLAVGDLQDRVAALSDELAVLRRQGATASPSAAPEPAADAPRGDAAARTAADEAAARYAIQRETAFRAEAADAAWAGRAGAIVRNALAGDPAAGSVALRSLECRSRSCRVEITSDVGEGQDRLPPSVAARLADTFGTIGVSYLEGPGGRAMVLHLSR